MIKTNEKKETKKDEVNVLTCRNVNGSYALDLEINGVTIYGCWYRTYTDKKSKEEKAFISFPSHKVEVNGESKYYNYAWFPISAELLADIEKQMNAML